MSGFFLYCSASEFLRVVYMEGGQGMYECVCVHTCVHVSTCVLHLEVKAASRSLP